MISAAINHALSTITSDAKLWVAYSGGLDSQVLLHALVNLKLPYHIRVIHVHHGLSPHADRWALFCQKTSEQYSLPFSCEKVDATPHKGESPESAARRARYTAFNKHLSAEDYLITAHHQDDQAETLLLQLLRGAGVKGVSAMSTFSTLSIDKEIKKVSIIRPLLSLSKVALEKYAKQHQLDWIEDESNANDNFDRNFLRLQVLPVIKQRWPQATRTLARATKLFSEAHDLLTDLAAIDFEHLKSTKDNRLQLTKLLALSMQRQQNVLRYWLAQHGWQPASRKQLQHFLSQLVAPNDKHPKLQHDQWVLQRYQGYVYLYPKLTEISLPKEISWDGESELILPGGLGFLTSSMVDPNWARPLTVRFRQGGERLKLPGHQHRHSLKKLWQQWQVPIWLRGQIPLLYAGDELVAVVGYTELSYTSSSDL